MTIACNLTNASDRFLLGKRYLIYDRDPVFSNEFRTILKAAGVNQWIRRRNHVTPEYVAIE